MWLIKLGSTCLFTDSNVRVKQNCNSSPVSQHLLTLVVTQLIFWIQHLLIIELVSG